MTASSPASTACLAYVILPFVLISGISLLSFAANTTSVQRYWRGFASVRQGMWCRCWERGHLARLNIAGLRPAAGE